MGGASEEVPQTGGETAEVVAGCARKKTGIEDDVGLLGPMIGDNNLTVSY